ncbi:MAG TPA: hypothetical protein VK498_01560 [Ferruginibacter sp.]|nr:hypothetical protein [Ferruginibacter sp.]
MKNLKKLQFAIQVFGLIAMIPTYLILEMNHGKFGSQRNTPPSNVMEKSHLKQLEKSKAQNDNTATITLTARISFN